MNDAYVYKNVFDNIDNKLCLCYNALVYLCEVEITQKI